MSALEAKGVKADDDPVAAVQPLRLAALELLPVDERRAVRHREQLDRPVRRRLEVAVLGEDVVPAQSDVRRLVALDVADHRPAGLDHPQQAAVGERVLGQVDEVRHLGRRPDAGQVALDDDAERFERLLALLLHLLRLLQLLLPRLRHLGHDCAVSIAS